MVFYDNGLRFSCISCGNCCRIEDGYVWLTHEAEQALLEKFGIEKKHFRHLYTEVVDKKLALKSFPNGDCIFYDEKTGCKVYDARPLQCRTFPFWPENVKSLERWQCAATTCPGIDSGELHNKNRIESCLQLMEGRVIGYK